MNGQRGPCAWCSCNKNLLKPDSESLTAVPLFKDMRRQDMPRVAISENVRRRNGGSYPCNRPRVSLSMTRWRGVTLGGNLAEPCTRKPADPPRLSLSTSSLGSNSWGLHGFCPEFWSFCLFAFQHARWKANSILTIASVLIFCEVFLSLCLPTCRLESQLLFSYFLLKILYL